MSIIVPNNDKYPRTYLPGDNKFFPVILSLLTAGSIVSAVKKIGIFNLPWYLLVIFLVMSVVMLQYLLEYVYYRVTIEQSALKIKSIAGEKTIQRKDIKSYCFVVNARGVSRIRFNLKSDRKPSPFDILHDNAGATVYLPLTFDYDREFHEWVTSLPLEAGFPCLPEIRA